MPDREPVAPNPGDKQNVRRGEPGGFKEVVDAADQRRNRRREALDGAKRDWGDRGDRTA